MPSIEQLVRQNINPFDSTTFRPGNFWKESQDESQEVATIHKEVLDSVEQTLESLLRDRKTRTLMLIGDAGSGKSYLLGRLKRRLNDKACFAYVTPWPDSKFIWRHVLRQTVDSLLETPEGQSESQLLRWLNGLEVLKRQGLAKRIRGERSVFIGDMRASFPSGLYRPRDFFSVLYALLDESTRMTASDWLRGEDLDEDELKRLKVKSSLDSEDAAQKILGNFGQIADSTQPIVICFDNLDNIPSKANGKPDLQAMFNVNSTLHNERINNFLILVSIITSNWRDNRGAIAHADRDRIDDELNLRLINLDEAEAIWASRLQPLHANASQKPASRIVPLTRNWLEHKYPGGKVAPRECLILAEELIRTFKKEGSLPDISETVIEDNADMGFDQQSAASFELLWQKEFKGVGDHLLRISQFSSPDLIRRLQEALEALEIPKVQRAILGSNAYCSYSLGHEHSERVCVVWTEDSNLRSFYDVMKACEKMVKTRVRDRIYLIRKEKLGTAKNKGYQLFQEIFSKKKNTHIKPDLEAVQYLETYHRLVNSAAGGELVIGAKTPNVKELQALVRESDVLSTCSLLQQLGVVSTNGGGGGTSNGKISDIEAAKHYILNLMTTQALMGMQALVESTQDQFPALDAAAVVSLIHSLCEANRIQMLDPNAKPENQLLCYVPA